MATVLTRCRVADFDAWKPQYEGFTASIPELLEYRIWQGVDDPTLVLILERWESRDAVEAVINDPALEEAMAEHGVDTSSLTLDFLDEVVSRSREPNAADK